MAASFSYAPQRIIGKQKSLLFFCFPSVLCLQEEAESLEDASNEIMLLDETELRCMWGEVFLHMPKDSLEEELERRKEAVQNSRGELEAEKEAVTSKMAELKKVLYAKFKDSINLEEE